jgi:hypothetical protein
LDENGEEFMASLSGLASRLLLGLAFSGTAILLASQSGCATRGPSSSADQSNADVQSAEASPNRPTTGPSSDQLTFQSAADASDALITAAKEKDRDQLHKILGPALDDLVSGDPVQDANDLDRFAKHAAEGDRLEQVSDDKAIVHIGSNDWPFPIPIEKQATGQ